MPAVIKWMSIQLLHNVVRTQNYLNEYEGHPLSAIAYKGKVKLHGTNCGVQVRADGIFPQSRGEVLTLPSGDFKGFARWVEEHGDYWASMAPGLTVFGEWCGQGIMSGTALNQIGKKVYAIFAVQVGYDEDARIVYEPSEIQALLSDKEHPEVYVLPWFGAGEVTIDYADKAGMETAVDKLNEVVEAVETEDPWVKEVFGVSGIGEGLVMYPVGEHATGNIEVLSRTMFKAKGVKHAKVKVKVRQARQGQGEGAGPGRPRGRQEHR
jgi:hypothetical protein